MSSGSLDQLQPVPDAARLTWREHWGLFAQSDAGDCSVLVHVSTDPVRRHGVFTVIAWVDGQRVKDIHPAVVPTCPVGRTAVASDRLTLELVEADRRCTVAYRGDDLELDLAFDTRYGGWDFPPGTTAALYPVHNHQLPVAVSGVVRLRTPEGAVLDRGFAGRGSRDHSWGWFPEMLFADHLWVAVSGDAEFLQFTCTRARDGVERRGGFASDVGGAGWLGGVSVDDPYWSSDPDAHLPPLTRDVTVSAFDGGGRRREARLRLSEAVAAHHSNRRDRELDRIYEQVTLFCPATIEGAAATAVVELGKLLERPGVCDEPIPGAPASKG